MVFMGCSGQIIVILVVEAVVGVVMSQMLGAIWVGRLISEVFLIFTEHLRVMSGVLFVYRAIMQLGGLASGW